MLRPRIPRISEVTKQKYEARKDVAFFHLILIVGTLLCLLPRSSAREASARSASGFGFAVAFIQVPPSAALSVIPFWNSYPLECTPVREFRCLRVVSIEGLPGYSNNFFRVIRGRSIRVIRVVFWFCCCLW